VKNLAGVLNPPKKIFFGNIRKNFQGNRSLPFLLKNLQSAKKAR
jgi:hypothetical protein